MVERAATSKPVGAGITLGPNAMMILRRLGLVPIGDRAAVDAAIERYFSQYEALNGQ